MLFLDRVNVKQNKVGFNRNTVLGNIHSPYCIQAFLCYS